MTDVDDSPGTRHESHPVGTGLRLDPLLTDLLRDQLRDRRRAHDRGRHGRGAGVRRGAERPDGREHRERGADGAGRVPAAGLAADAPSTRALRCRPRSRVPTPSAGARLATAGRPTRCSRRTGWAPGSPGASCPPRRWPTACRPARWLRSPSWSSPTSTSCPRPSVAGHADELASSGRIRERDLQRLARALVLGEPPDVLRLAATRADWNPPRTLTAVLLPPAQVRPVVGLLDQRTLHTGMSCLDCPRTWRCLLVPEIGAGGPTALMRTLAGRHAVVGSDPFVARGAGVLRPGPARGHPAARARLRWTPRSTWSRWCSPRTTRPGRI